MSVKPTTSVKEYLEATEPETVDLGDAVFKIRGLTIRSLGKLITVLGIKGPGIKIDRDMIMDKLDEVAEVILPQCVIEPEFTATGEQGKIPVDRIKIGHLTILVDRILSKTGLGTETGKERESFQ